MTNTLGIILSIAIGAMITLSLFLRSRHNGAPPLSTRRRRVAALDLAPVRDKAIKRHGWPEAKARSLEADYRDFLMLLAENPGRSVSPWTDDLDLFWHEHILDTQRYAADCDAIFGRFVRHDPHIDQNPYRHEATKRSTMELRAEQLRARDARRAAERARPGEVGDGGFDTVMWGCATDASHHGAAGDHGSGHGHGHDTSGGHSCGGHGGGHSRGGHSCGGHSCGGGH